MSEERLTPASPAVTKRERLEARITPEQKALFQRAAALAGRSLSDFVVGSALAAAEETIRNRQVITLTARDSLTFAEAIVNPPAPNENLRALAERYREFTGE
ncbi:MAG: DUF1778 domain-containing protein [Chloroflexota bacterium]|nr:DUF1778 domain-containing protein [Chloroflexota bacterium]